MFDLHYDVRRCRENNRLEAKKAYGGPAPQHLGRPTPPLPTPGAG